jgi:hypothetical protein
VYAGCPSPAQNNLAIPVSNLLKHAYSWPGLASIDVQSGFFFYMFNLSLANKSTGRVTTSKIVCLFKAAQAIFQLYGGCNHYQ